jgi:hypothetical protein
MLIIFFIIAKLKSRDFILIVVPDYEVEEFISKPSPSWFTLNLSDIVYFFKHIIFGQTELACPAMFRVLCLPAEVCFVT